MNSQRCCVSMALAGCFVVAGLLAPGVTAAEPPALVEWEIVACKDPQARKDLEKKQIDILTGNAPWAEKDRACRMLKVLGTADAVPALAALLPNAELSHMARYALESMPCAEAGKALRDSLPKTSGKARVGVINSLAVREDAAAVGPLAALLKDADAELVAAAASALGRIAAPEAVAALADFRAKAPKEFQAAAAEGSLRAAERLMRLGNRAEAAKIYEELQAPSWPTHVRMGAFAGIVAARPAEAAPRLLQAMGGDDPLMRGLAAQLAAAMPGADATKTLAAGLSKLPPAGQAALLRALATRKDPAARPAVLAAARNSDQAVGVAAVTALGVIGSAAEVPMLATLAATDDGQLGAAARMSLAAMQGDGVDEAMAAALKGSTPAARVQLLDALAARSAKACVASIVASLGDADAPVRMAALKALAALGGKPEAAPTVKALKAAKDAPERTAALDAILAISSRGRQDVLPEVLAAMEGADAASRTVLLRALARIGGEKALAAVKAAVADTDEQVQDEAVRVLSDWPDPAAAPVLLELARTATKQNRQVLGLRGYVRLAAQETSAATRSKMLTEALDLAKRPDEKRLVLSAWGGVPTVEALKVVMKYLDDPAVSTEAGIAAVAIAAAAPAADKALVAEAMTKVLAQCKDAKTRQQAEKILAGAKK